MLQLLCVLVSFAASTVGAICGIGGGVLMKPILDATGAISIAEASVLSSCTVLIMSLVSLYRRTRGNGLRELELKCTLPLAVGAVIGGFAGKALFRMACLAAGEATAGIWQNAILMVLTLLNVPYLLLEDKIRRFHISSGAMCVLAGIFLGMASSFLGIGGGPINLLFLSLLFSMGIKTAGLNSIFIIAFSQAASLINTAAAGGLSQVNPLVLALMVVGGIAGGTLGSGLNRRFTEKQVSQLLLTLLFLISLVCAFNIRRLL